MTDGEAIQRYGPDALFVVQIVNIAEAMGNLNYLIDADADNPELVRSYLHQSEEYLERLVALARARRDQSG
jgi:hypothetical protein